MLFVALILNNKQCYVLIGTVAILAQGTHWDVSQQAFIYEFFECLRMLNVYVYRTAEAAFQMCVRTYNLSKHSHTNFVVMLCRRCCCCCFSH
jgi:hypothetical protein